MTTPFVTTGISTSPGPNGAVPIRREIRDLKNNFPQQWDLYLLGLNRMQSVDENDQLSYYQISGIHGLPYQSWNGVPGLDGQETGYCTHSSILFLPWHRPYLALYEQILYNHVQAIAAQYPTDLRPQYVAAAKTFRIPFWDWGLDPGSGNSFPDAVAGPANISVTGTNGKPTTIPNPLYQYQFDPSLTSQDFPDQPFSRWPTTFRYPTGTGSNAQSQPNQLNAAINSQVRNTRSMVRYIMSAITSFGPFSNTEWIPGNVGGYASLEDIHDNIHGLIGGPSPSQQRSPPGNMSIVPYAGFDPAFWLHHCNVDRLFAIWQDLHPTSYVQPEPSQFGTFTRLPGDTEDVSSPLTPFWQDPSTFHTSESVRSSPTLGYAYPETQSWNFKSTDDYQKSIRAVINRLYGSTVGRPTQLPIRSLAAVPAASRSAVPENVTTTNAPKDLPTNQDKAAKTPEAKTSFIEKVKETIESHLPHSHKNPEPSHNPGKGQDDIHKIVAPGGKYKEWITNIRAPKHGLGGPFQVHIFIRDVPPDNSSWVVHDNNVGTYTVLGSDKWTTSCEKCKSDADRELVVTGIIPLTEALIERVVAGELKSLEPDDVVPYLKKDLHWRVTLGDGTDKPREDISGLQISVVSTDVTLPEDPSELPKYSGNYTIHPECTEGRPCGYSDGDTI